MQYIQIIDNRLKDMGITAKKMLLDLGYSDGLISTWRKGVEPSAIKLHRIAEYIGLSMDYLLTGQEINGNISVGEITANNGSIGVNNAPATITVNNGHNTTRELSKEEIELLKIYNSLDVKSRHKILNLAFELEENKNNE